MSKRLTKEWTSTAEGAYGASGKKGRSGELFFAEVYRAKGWHVIDRESNKQDQLQGNDIILIDSNGNDYTIDVKNNLKDNGNFYVEVHPRGWLFNPTKKSAFISHVNTDTKTIVTYLRTQMVKFIKEKYADYSNELLKLNIKELNFIKINKVEHI